MSEAAEDGRVGDGAVERAGYEPELKRTLGSFQVFAISFAFISVAVGVFGTYEELLSSAGPVGIWLWVVVAVGQLLVALVFAQFAARISLSGSAYQWASRLASPKIGWGFGWLSFWYAAIGVVAVDNALASQALMPLLAMEPDEGTARLITLVVLVVQAVLVAASTRIVGIVNAASVALELGVVAVLTVALIVAIVVSDSGAAVENLTSRGVAEDAPGYFALGGGLMGGMLMGLATLIGFDAAANLAEEAKDPFRSVPRAIVGSVAAAAVLGLVFLIALTVSIDDIGRVTASDSPVAAIIQDRLGNGMERALLVGISLAFFGAGMAVMASCSRIVFAMARDGRFPAHGLLRRVNPRTHTPIPATVLIVVVGVVLMVALPGSALINLITASTILPAIIYGATIVLYLAVRTQLGRQDGAFNLGRLELPVAIAALIWVLVALFVLVVPGDSLAPDLIVGGLIVVGALFFVSMLVFDPSAMETEPGDGP